MKKRMKYNKQIELVGFINVLWLKEDFFLARILKFVLYLTLVLLTESVCRDNQTENGLYCYTNIQFIRFVKA